MKLKMKETLAKILQYLFKCERRTLLWTNTSGSQTSYSNIANVSGYDFIEVWFERNGAYQIFRISASVTGTIYFLPLWGDYITRRAASITNNKLSFGNGGYFSNYNTGQFISGGNYAIPYRVYGIVGGGTA